MNPVTSETILQLEERRRQGMLAADVPLLRELLADDLVYAHSNGDTDSKAVYLAQLQQGHLRYLKVQLEQLTVQLMGSAAAVHGRMTASIEVRGQPREVQSHFLTVWSQQDDGVWRLRCHQGTPRAA